MLYEVHVSGPSLMSVQVRPRVAQLVQPYFLRRSKGGGHVWFIVDEEKLELFKQIWPEIKQEYEEFEKEHGRTATITYTVSEMPIVAEAFFRKVREYVPLDFRVQNSTVEVAVYPEKVGRFIGKKGWRVKGIANHIGLKVRVVSGIRVVWDDEERCYRLGSLEGKKLPEDFEPHYFTGFRNPEKAYSITDGWVAPWRITLAKESEEDGR